MAGPPDSADESHQSGGTAVRTETRDDGELRAGLRQRHVTMISIAGVIGAGLFKKGGASSTKTRCQNSHPGTARCERVGSPLSGSSVPDQPQ